MKKIFKIPGMGVLGGKKNTSPILFSDDFARSDGTVGNGWVGTTWTIVTGKIINTPNLGDELLTDGAMETWASSTDLTNWTESLQGTSTVNQDTSDKHGGSSSVRIDVDALGSSAYIFQALSGTGNRWVHVDMWAKSISTRGVRTIIDNLSGLCDASYIPGEAWARGYSTHRVTAASKSLVLVKGNQSSQSLWFDDVSVKELPEAELSLNRPAYPTPDYILSLSIASIQQNTMAGIRFAMDDPSNPQNYLLAVMDNATAARYLKLYKCLNGTVTRLQLITQAFTANDVLKVVKSGTSVRIFLNDVPMFATQTVSDAAIKDNLYAGIFSTYFGNQFDNWGEKVRADGGSSTFLDPFFTDGNIFPIGDSITEGSSDEVNGTGYPVVLTAALNAQMDMYWTEKPARFAAGGDTVAIIKAGIDAALSARTDTPTHILILLGTNDVVSMPTEADWKANYNYILDALHVKWAAAKIYLSSSYRYGELTNLTTLKGWMADLIAARSSYCFVGIDTYPLYNGHPELLADGLHPNHAGYIVMAAAWKTLLGY